MGHVGAVIVHHGRPEGGAKAAAAVTFCNAHDTIHFCSGDRVADMAYELVGLKANSSNLVGAFRSEGKIDVGGSNVRTVLGYEGDEGLKQRGLLLAHDCMVKGWGIGQELRCLERMFQSHLCKTYLIWRGGKLKRREIGLRPGWGVQSGGRKGGKRKSPALETKDTEKNLSSGDVNGYGRRTYCVSVMVNRTLV